MTKSPQGTNSRVVSTSIHGPGLTACGVAPKPTEERCNLRQNHHPGFGYLRLTRNGKEVWATVLPEESRSLGWIERTHVNDDDATWRLESHGAMTSYTLIRRRKGYWVVEKSGLGFA